MIDRLLSTREVAELLSVNQKSVRRYAMQGRLHAIKVGGNVRYEEGDVQAFINSGRGHRVIEQPASPVRQPR